MKVRWEDPRHWDTLVPEAGTRHAVDAWKDDTPLLLGRITRFDPMYGDVGRWELDAELHLNTRLPRASEWAELDDAKRAVEEAVA